jgi:hypothetical protein
VVECLLSKSGALSSNASPLKINKNEKNCMLTWFLKLSDCIINICSCICIIISHHELLKSWNYVCCFYFQSIFRDRHIADVQVVYETKNIPLLSITSCLYLSDLVLEVVGLELRAYTWSSSTPQALFVLGIFDTGSRDLFAWSSFELQS